MPHWTDRPDIDDRVRTYRLHRVGPGGKIQGTCLNDRHVGTHTHYWHGRTIPCEGDECPACKAGHRPRWYAWLPLWNSMTANILILEVTERCAFDLNAYLGAYETMRGATVAAQRIGKKPNSPVQLSIKPPPCANMCLPEPIELEEILCRIWERNLKEDRPARKLNLRA